MLLPLYVNSNVLFATLMLKLPNASPVPGGVTILPVTVILPLVMLPVVVIFCVPFANATASLLTVNTLLAFTDSGTELT